jgi:hypothetical protein
MEAFSSPYSHEPFVDAERAATFLDMRRRTLLSLARQGKLPGHPVGFGQRRMWKFQGGFLEQTKVSERKFEVDAPQEWARCMGLSLARNR